MFSRPKILFLVSLLFVALLNSIPTYLLNFKFFYHSSIYKSTLFTHSPLVYPFEAIKQDFLPIISAAAL